VNNQNLLADALYASPDDFILAEALGQVLEEEGDMVASEAVKHVENVQQAGRDARDVARAAELLAPDSGYRLAILGVLVAQCDLDPHREVVVYVVAGNGPPHARLSCAGDGPHSPLVAHVTAPASTVLRAYRGIVHLVRRDHWTKAAKKK
jgi:hypothetical protein